MGLVRQNLFQCLEDLGSIWLDMMRVYYGVRYVEPGGTVQEGPERFDFARLGEVPLSVKLDVGGSAYWSEIAQMNTLDNLLMRKEIDVLDYLERIPNGYISNQQELIRTLRQRRQEASEGGGEASAPFAPGGTFPKDTQEGAPPQAGALLRQLRGASPGAVGQVQVNSR
ncbi:hypothetical protein SDC9_146464 [bioreactor metagenome]|uniref:Uncharacterized protein n=1 Tax=bioreactor metagenome TaxID=1076179 RepID=A0A645EES9_9ZZZZ